MARFLGFVPLGLSITGSVCTKDTNGQPANPVAPPTYRIYGPTGVMLNGTGSMFAEDSGTISGATNASPIVITDTDHNLSTGTLVTLSGIGGNTAANGTFN